MDFDKQQKILVPHHFAGTRLDKTIKELFDVPWSTARGWIERGKIAVEERVVTDLSFAVPEDTQIVFTPDAQKPETVGMFHPKSNIYKDTHLVVANKPVDVLTVPFENGDKNTFDMQLRSHLAKILPKNPKRRGALPSLMVVHRLDKLTSGLLVFPRTFEAKEALAEQFRAHTVKRFYLALVHGLATSKKIETHIMKDRGDGIRGSCETSPHAKVRRSRNGQLAITHVELLEHLRNASLIKCKLDTGRTNQIRIHMAEQGHPLIGERTYMRGYKGKRIDSLRLMLHAQQLGFVHPITNEPMDFEVKPPEHFSIMLNELKNKDTK